MSKVITDRLKLDRHIIKVLFRQKGNVNDAQFSTNVFNRLLGKGKHIKDNYTNAKQIYRKLKISGKNAKISPDKFVDWFKRVVVPAYQKDIKSGKNNYTASKRVKRNRAKRDKISNKELHKIHKNNLKAHHHYQEAKKHSKNGEKGKLNKDVLKDIKLIDKYYQVDKISDLANKIKKHQVSIKKTRKELQPVFKKQNRFNKEFKQLEHGRFGKEALKKSGFIGKTYSISFFAKVLRRQGLFNGGTHKMKQWLNKVKLIMQLSHCSYIPNPKYNKFFKKGHGLIIKDFVQVKRSGFIFIANLLKLQKHNHKEFKQVVKHL